jgi:sterol desaturase/sphingolipid hydroxylase (fatty acid hydroxylase superfamily)
MEKNFRIQLAFVIYLIFMAIIIVVKPSHMYNSDGSLKQFGSGQNKTLFPFWFIIFLGAFLSYYLSHVALFVSSSYRRI